MALLPGILFDLMGKPGMDPPIADLEMDGLQSGPGLAIETELVGSILLTFEFCKLQSFAECWFIDIFLLDPPRKIKLRENFPFKHAIATTFTFHFALQLYFGQYSKGWTHQGFLGCPVQWQTPPQNTTSECQLSPKRHSLGTPHIISGCAKSWIGQERIILPFISGSNPLFWFTKQLPAHNLFNWDVTDRHDSELRQCLSNSSKIQKCNTTLTISTTTNSQVEMLEDYDSLFYIICFRPIHNLRIKSNILRDNTKLYIEINKPIFAAKFSWFSIILGLPPIMLCFCNTENALRLLTDGLEPTDIGLSKDMALLKSGRMDCTDWELLIPVKELKYTLNCIFKSTKKPRVSVTSMISIYYMDIYHTSNKPQKCLN